MTSRDERYRHQVANLVTERDEWRRIAVDAVAALLVKDGDDLGLLDGYDAERVDAGRRAVELRTLVHRPR